MDPWTKRKTKEELPEDLIQDEILTRLQPKSLLRFWSVSKSWNSLFSKPQFIISHLTHQNPNYLICKYHDSKVRIVSGSIETPIHDVPLMGSNFIGAINGLVCFIFGDKFFFWNAAIRQYKETSIPSELLDIKNKCTKFNKHVYGFSWDPLGNDYKVVILCVLSGNLKQCAVYSCKSESWTQVAVLPILGARSYTSSKSTPSTIVKACPYWSYSKYLFLPGKEKKRRYMAMFKFVAENNELRLLPEFDCSVIGGRELHLVSLRDSLVGLTYKFKNGLLSDCLDVYRLDQEGRGGVWSKTYNIGPVNFNIWWGLEGETLIRWLGDVFCCYDRRTNEKNDVIDVQALISHKEICFRYLPSLVIIPGMKPLIYF